jgi:hypothetical protein
MYTSQFIILFSAILISASEKLISEQISNVTSSGSYKIHRMCAEYVCKTGYVMCLGTASFLTLLSVK